MFLYPTYSHQFKSMKQVIDEWNKGAETVSKILDLLSRISDEYNKED